MEPLFEDELTNQAAGPKPKHKSKRTKAYTAAEDKTPRPTPNKSIQLFGFVYTGSFMSARSFRLTEL